MQVRVEDPDRSEAAEHVLKELKGETKAFEKLFRKSGKQLSDSYKNHAADRDQAIAILDSLNAGWEAYQNRALDPRFELRDSLTEKGMGRAFQR